MRFVTVAGIAAAVAAALGIAQVAVAELTGITTLGGEFAAGNERVQGVQLTLVAWYCSVAVALAVASVSARRDADEWTRLAAVPAAAVGALAAWPLLARVSGDYLRDDVVAVTLAGIGLGVAGALAVAAVPVIGRGLAAYVVLQWAAGLAFTAPLPRTTVYAGMVEPLGPDFLARMRPSMPDFPHNLGYHVPGMLPVAITVLVLTGVVAAVAARRTGAWAASTASAASGPVLAAVTYRVTPAEHMNLWNEAASLAVLTLAACCLPVAAVAAAVFGRGRPAP